MIHAFDLNGKTLKWDDDVRRDNNLWIEDASGKKVWGMEDVRKSPMPDSCTVVSVEDDGAFRFGTWLGMSYVIDGETFEIKEKLLSK